MALTKKRACVPFESENSSTMMVYDRVSSVSIIWLILDGLYRGYNVVGLHATGVTLQVL